MTAFFRVFMKVTNSGNPKVYKRTACMLQRSI